MAASGRVTIWHGHCRFEAALAEPVIMPRLPLLVPPLVKAARPSRVNSHETLPYVLGMIGVSVSARRNDSPATCAKRTRGQRESMLLSRQPRGVQG
jgi:hypothetical protein